MRTMRAMRAVAGALLMAAAAVLVAANFITMRVDTGQSHHGSGRGFGDSELFETVGSIAAVELAVGHLDVPRGEPS